MTTTKTTFMNSLLSQVLTKSEEIIYKYAYEFSLSLGNSVSEAHGDALRKVFSKRKLAQKMQDEVWINLETGEKIKSNF